MGSGRASGTGRRSRCLRCLLLVMCTYPFAKKALTLHLERGEGRERYIGCNLMQGKVLASSHQHLMAGRDTKLLIYGLFQKGRVLAQDSSVTSTATSRTSKWTLWLHGASRWPRRSWKRRRRPTENCDARRRREGEGYGLRGAHGHHPVVSKNLNVAEKLES